MQSSQFSDIIYSQSTNSVKMVLSSGSTQSIDNLQLNFYKTPDFSHETPIKQIEGQLVVQKKTLRQLQSIKFQKSYLNLQIVQPPKPREVLNKYVVENNIQFHTPQNIEVVYYHIDYDRKLNRFNFIQFASKNITYCLVDTDYANESDIMRHGLIENENCFLGNQYQLSTEFISFIGNLNKICLIIGFRQSSGSYPLLEKLIKISIEHPAIIKKYGIKSQESKNDLTIKYLENILELSSVYFIDAQMLIYDSLRRDQKVELASSDINSYIKLFKKDAKPANDISARRDELLQLSDIVTNLNLITKKMDWMKQLQVPLSYALYETPVTCIQQYFMRHYFAAGYMFMFDNIGDQQEIINQSYKGGLIEHIQEDRQYKLLENEVRGDFFSLYATIIAALNISPETSVDQPSKDTLEVDTNYQSKNSTDYTQDIPQNKVYFNQNNKGIITQIVINLLERRKITEDPIEKASLKTILASIYGLIGQKISPFYSFKCASAICAYARYACDVARQCIIDTDECCCNYITVRNTDSVSYILKKEGFKGNVTKPKTAYKKMLTNGWPMLQKKIQKTLNSELFDFKLETDKFAIFTMYSHQKKAYLRVVCDFESFINAKEKDTNIKTIETSLIEEKGLFKLDVKGPFSWTSYSQQRIQANQKLFIKVVTQIFFNKDSFEIAAKSLNEQIVQEETAVFDRLSECVSKGLIDYIHQYATFLRYSEDDKKCIFLRNLYNIKYATQIIPYLDESPLNQKLISNNIIPLHLITRENRNRILINSIVKDYFNPVKSFFNVKNSDHKQIKSFQLDKTVVLAEDECHIRIEQGYTSNGVSKVSHKYQVFKYYDLEHTILRSQNTSFHEIISRKHNKIFFDVDAEIPVTKEQVFRCVTEGIAKINQHYIVVPRIHIASAHKYKDGQMIKWSYHIVVDIQCHVSTNEYIAKQMNPMMMKLLNNENAKVFDLKVYNQSEGSTSSLRLPNCIKFDKDKKPEYRKFQIETEDSTFNDFIINRVSTCKMILPKCILFDISPPIHVQSINMKFAQEDIIQALQSLKTVSGVEFKHQIVQTKDIIILKCGRKIQCVVCKRMHDKEHLYMIKISNTKMIVNCYQNKKGSDDHKQSFTIELPQVQQAQQVDDKSRNLRQIMQQTVQEDFSDIATSMVQMRYIEFQISNNINYIISDLGTGKSQHLKLFLDGALKENNRATILCLSFRRTFSIEFAKKYDLENYMDIKGPLSAQSNPKLILQIDSLCRYDVDMCPTYLIVDEIESILEKMPSCQDYRAVVNRFITLLQNCEKVIVMDGLMEKKTIEYLNLIRNTDNFNVVYNMQSPRSDYKFGIYRYVTNDIVFVADMILKMVQSGKNVYGMITSKAQGKFVKDLLQFHKIKCIFYNGDDANIEVIETENGNEAISQMEIKSEHFQNVDYHWKQFQVVLHNSAVTAGVSFNDEHFHYQVNVFNAGTCSSLSFFQGLHRVRHIGSKEIITFVEEEFNSDFYTPHQFTDLQYQLDRDYDVTVNIDLSLDKQFETWLSAREGCAKRFRSQLLFKYIKKMNYQVQLLEYPQEYVRTSLEANNNLYDSMQDAVLTKEDLELGEREMLERYLLDKDNNSVEQLQQVQSKLVKINIMYKYGMSPCEINKLESAQLKTLHKSIHIQQMRIKILKTYDLKYNDIQSENWYVNKLNEYGHRRQYHTFSNDELQIFSLTQFVIHVRQQLLSGIPLDDIKQLMLKDPRITPFKKIVKINRRTKPTTLLNNLFTLFNNDIIVDGQNISFKLLDIKKEMMEDCSEQHSEIDQDEIEEEY